MSTFWIKAFELIVSLGLLVFIHELGHYTFSRLFGVKVDKFYLFFNPWFSIATWDPKKKEVRFFKRNPKEKQEPKKDEGKEAEVETTSTVEAKDKGLEKAPENGKTSWRDTVYGLGWLPLGGYCAINGMIDETTSAAQLSAEPQPWEFRSKPAWQRLLIMIGGVLFNFLLAVVIYAGMVLHYGEEFLPFKNATEGITYSESAHKIGFQDDDIPLSADGKELRYFDKDVHKIITANEVKVLRGTDTVAIKIPEKFVFTVDEDLKKDIPFIEYGMPVVIAQNQPRMGAEKAGMKKGDRIIEVNGVKASRYDVFTEQLKKHKGTVADIKFLRTDRAGVTKPYIAHAEIDNNAKLGITLASPADVLETETFHYNFFESIPRGIVLGCQQMATYVSSLKYIFTKEGAESLGGFGTIGSIFPDEWDWRSFWSITAFLSIILAFMNILPIPALDGGHVLFLLFEIITRRKPSEKFLERAQIIGMILLFALLLYANGNDIYKFLFK
ncbi:MAG: RIP metalloprotease RseP [Muribaculaceae bacterium]|nr:RIP metalloprotease RseP [Muribaculaceae bacterium]